jgi:hypothetical protein
MVDYVVDEKVGVCGCKSEERRRDVSKDLGEILQAAITVDV